jgi:glycosyltransferase involved in cell wall biosynthesis
VNSALGQNDVLLEVIVVDDGSSDDTPEWLRQASLDPRVRFLRNDTALGPAGARNVGLAVASGKWSAFLDDDDFWAPDKLRTQLDAAEQADAGFVYSATIVVTEGLVPLGVDPPPAPDSRLQDLLKHNSIPGGCSSAMATTESVRSVGGFDEQLWVLADWDLWLRLGGVRGAATHDPIVAYVEHSGGMHVTRARATLDELAYLREKHRRLLDEYDIEMGGGVWFSLWIAAGLRSAGATSAATRLYLEAALRARSLGALLRAGVGLFTDRLARQDLFAPLEPLETTPAWLRE